ncbi:hypothetical protein [Flavobacterium aquatile]|uniref:Uncharacterized protein n=1 Tax=Flavobacterium aquatile LMG 4008 = ATCC 11947 TaxID=1453498 RepID=A0A095U4B6_9FLAO|nr:hypothetical protein [Flavobacterium aquatile]KGD69498.1 hypothetical protein LG45_01660 [Flavobacterium aquatile LMG 4008 = ATCC 11947]OXA66047.1 hypothetical protein B0A61_12270 [Flavobacterium aquatile LMG 4008 = ATCC 11947]GEC77524.1 hypothetical protein FAQ01_03940 [Flavobacterium aquatile]
MKKFIYVIALFTSVMQAQVGIGTTTPSGALDVNSSLPLPSTHKAGLLPPIVALTATNSFTTTTVGSDIINPNGGGNPLAGTIVYNTNTSAAGANQVTPGYYYYNGTAWERFTSGTNSNWSLYGNAGTTPGTNYIGTSDSQALVVKTDNTERMRVEADGDVAIGTPTASNKLSVRHDQDGYGVMSVDNATAGGFSGIYFQQNTAYRGHIGHVNTGGTSTFGGKGLYQLASGDRPMIFSVGPAGSELFSERMRIDQIGNVGISTTNPTAKLTIGAGTATINTAPLKFTAGTNLTAVENGAVEYDGTNYFATSGGTRYTIAKILTGSATIDFGNRASENSNPLTQTITVIGAQPGDPVILGLPNAVMNSNSERHAHYMAWVSAVDTVTIKFSNPTSADIDPDSGTFKVSVVRY